MNDFVYKVEESFNLSPEVNLGKGVTCCFFIIHRLRTGGSAFFHGES